MARAREKWNRAVGRGGRGKEENENENDREREYKDEVEKASIYHSVQCPCRDLGWTGRPWTRGAPHPRSPGRLHLGKNIPIVRQRLSRPQVG